MKGTIDDRYFEWLYSHIGSVRNRNPSRSWWSLARQLYSKPFTWFVPNDDNRIADAIELRFEYIDIFGSEGITQGWLDMDCSVFEMLYALARRASFEATGTPSDWFWKFMDNMDIRGWNDRHYTAFAETVIDEALDMLINRTYREDGFGGLFPLKNAPEDQRKVEIWYQMSTYLLESEFVDDAPVL